VVSAAGRLGSGGRRGEKKGEKSPGKKVGKGDGTNSASMPLFDYKDGAVFKARRKEGKKGTTWKGKERRKEG